MFYSNLILDQVDSNSVSIHLILSKQAQRIEVNRNKPTYLICGSHRAINNLPSSVAGIHFLLYIVLRMQLNGR